jgi:hypothetical protein
MKELNKQDAIFSRFELSLGPEKRLFYLEVVKLVSEIKFYLIDYYGWPVTDFNLISEARQKFTIFNSQKG